MPTHAVTPSSNFLQKPMMILPDRVSADWSTVTDWVYVLYVTIWIENFETKVNNLVGPKGNINGGNLLLSQNHQRMNYYNNLV